MGVLSYPVFQAGSRLINGSDLTKFEEAVFGTQFTPGVNTNIVARSGGGQANATLLRTASNHLLTVAADADSVRLPPDCQPGQTIWLSNPTATGHSCQVFGTGAQTINDVAAATGVAVAQGKSAMFKLCAPNKWYMILTA